MQLCCILITHFAENLTKLPTVLLELLLSGKSALSSLYFRFSFSFSILWNFTIARVFDRNEPRTCSVSQSRNRRIGFVLRMCRCSLGSGTRMRCPLGWILQFRFSLLASSLFPVQTRISMGPIRFDFLRSLIDVKKQLVPLKALSRTPAAFAA